MNTETTQSLGETRRRVEAMNAKARQKELDAKHKREMAAAHRRFPLLRLKHSMNSLENPFREIASAMR